MKILRNYVLKELSILFILALSIFIFILVMGNIIKLTDLVINKGVQLIYVVKLFLYLVPSLLIYALPIAILSATLLVFGRMAADNELIAIQASGISIFKIFLPIFILGIMLSFLSLALNDKILPRASFAARTTLTQIGIKKPQAYLEAGTFIKSFEGYIIFIGNEKNGKFSNITIYEPRPDGPPKIIIAKKAEILNLEQNNNIRLKLMDVISDEPGLSEPDKFYKMKFKTYLLNLKIADEIKLGKISKKPKDLSIKELKEEIYKLKQKGIDANPLLAEIHRKISLSFAPLFFVLIGFPLAILAKRPEKSIGFAISLCVVIVYYLLAVAGQTLAKNGIFYAWFDVWLSNIIIFFASLFLIFKVAKK